MATFQGVIKFWPAESFQRPRRSYARREAKVLFKVASKVTARK